METRKMQLHSRPQENRVVRVLNALAEGTATVIPLVALVLGIGMIRLIPPHAATPLFSSDQEAAAFFKEHGLSGPIEEPIMLVSSVCFECNAVRNDLYSNGVGFDEVDITSSYGAALYEQAKAVSASDELPQIIIGTNLVKPDASSVKRVLGHKR
jgi:glutaredoxin